MPIYFIMTNLQSSTRIFIIDCFHTNGLHKWSYLVNDIDLSLILNLAWRGKMLKSGYLLLSKAHSVLDLEHRVLGKLFEWISFVGLKTRFVYSAHRKGAVSQWKYVSEVWFQDANVDSTRLWSIQMWMTQLFLCGPKLHLPTMWDVSNCAKLEFILPLAKCISLGKASFISCYVP